MNFFPLRRVPTFRHIAIDTETLSLSPVSAVLSIGMVNFDLHTGEVLSSIQINVDSDIDVNYLGGLESQDTVDWWNRSENEEAFRLSTNHQLAPLNALQLTTDWLKAYAPNLWSKPNDYCVWTMGSEFDPPILNQWSERILNRYHPGMRVPAGFPDGITKGLLPRQCLADMRLLFKLWPGKVSPPKQVAHTALADAQSQMETILKYRRLGMLNGMFNQMRHLP